MNPPAQAAAASRSTTTTISARGSAAPGGTIGRSGRRGAVERRQTWNAKRSARRLSLLTAHRPPDHETRRDQDSARQEPGDHPLRYRPEVPEPPAAAIVRVLRRLDVRDDRVQLAV